MDMLLIQFQAVGKGLKRVAPLAIAALMGPFGVVVGHEGVQVGLDFIKRAVQLFPECHIIEFSLDGLVQLLHRAIGLEMAHLGPGVLDVVGVQK